MEYTFHYDNLTQRKAIIAQQEALGHLMIHDDFDPDWQPGTEPHGTLTFEDVQPPVPPTPDQLLLRQLDDDSNSYHTQALRAYKN